MENEALNSTIAVHEQLVLTQKMATAQALALAGLTRKPRAGGGGGAGTAAKKMTKAHPSCHGIISAATAGGGNAAPRDDERWRVGRGGAAAAGIDQDMLLRAPST